MKNENGLTLVEVLVGLAILSIVMVILGGLLIDGFKNSDKSEKITTLQQEANLIITELRNIHWKNENYIIHFNKDSIITEKSQITLNEKYNYKFEKFDKTENKYIDMTGELTSQEMNNLPIKLTISYEDDATIPPYETETILSRLGGND
ncbi:PilW family protein [Metabacillus fastidiosus]|uniref:PilW family protein n=1 Tax=Metabacillus fastidiosus TaxID=1458 RepID=UPI003D2CFC82